MVLGVTPAEAQLSLFILYALESMLTLETFAPFRDVLSTRISFREHTLTLLLCDCIGLAADC